MTGKDCGGPLFWHAIPNFSFLGSLEVVQIYLPGWLGGWLGGWVGGLTVIIMQVSVIIGLNSNLTGTELGNRKTVRSLAK